MSPLFRAFVGKLYVETEKTNGYDGHTAGRPDHIPFSETSTYVRICRYVGIKRFQVIKISQIKSLTLQILLLSSVVDDGTHTIPTANIIDRSIVLSLYKSIDLAAPPINLLLLRKEK